jgi:hypothetical protein
VNEHSEEQGLRVHASRYLIAFIAMAKIFAPNRFRAAVMSWKPPSERRLSNSCFHGVWHRMALPHTALPSAGASKG